jgi:hypothetical protein
MTIEQIIPVVSSLVPTAAIDVVGVYDQNFRQVFPNARPLKAEIKEVLKPMENPIETGAESTDHVVFLPTEITLYLFVGKTDYKQTYKAIQQLHQNATLLTVQTYTGSYQNQLIEAMPHTEDADIFNAIMMIMKLHETQFSTAEFEAVPRNPANANPVQRGTVNSSTSPPPEKKRSILAGIFSREP